MHCTTFMIFNVQKQYIFIFRKTKSEEDDLPSASSVQGQHQGTPGTSRDRAPRLNLLESRLREELSLETLVFR